MENYRLYGEAMSDVVELSPEDPKATVCGTCGRGWDDSVSTSLTPTPSGRCPFEWDHDEDVFYYRDQVVSNIPAEILFYICVKHLTDDPTHLSP